MAITNKISYALFTLGKYHGKILGQAFTPENIPLQELVSNRDEILFQRNYFSAKIHGSHT